MKKLKPADIRVKNTRKAIMDRILIVEDDSSIRKALTMGLTSKNYEVDSAEDGDTGIYKGTRERYDVLVTDLCLPDYKGIEVIKKIRKHTPDIIPIIITGRGSMETSIEAIRLRVADYLEKPVSLKTVHNAIIKGLKKRSSDQDKTRGPESVQANVEGHKTSDDFIKSIPGMAQQINNSLTEIEAAVTLAKRSPGDSGKSGKLEQHLSTVLKASRKIALTSKSIMNFGKRPGKESKPLMQNKDPGPNRFM